MEELEKHFQTLGINPGANMEEIKCAYRDMVKVWHPDRFCGNERLQSKAQEKLKEINEAFSTIRLNYIVNNRQRPYGWNNKTTQTKKESSEQGTVYKNREAKNNVRNPSRNKGGVYSFGVLGFIYLDDLRPMINWIIHQWKKWVSIKNQYIP